MPATSSPMELPVPSVRSFSHIYTPHTYKHQHTRIQNLLTRFQREFQSTPCFVARSPGRVNLIGEHIDYSGYEVLPMALEGHDFLIAVKWEDRNEQDPLRITVANVSPEFPKRSFEVDAVDKITIDSTKHEWSHYFLSGVKGVLANLPFGSIRNMSCLVDGSVPAGAGVSSSSAFVCCSALATVTTNGVTMTKKQLTETAIVSERFVGVESGGMDQSCSIFGQPNGALLIHFHPSLSVESVPIPSLPDGPEATPTFVIAHTLVVSDKHVTAPVCYNLRVVETRFAALVLARKMNVDKEVQASRKVTLRMVQECSGKTIEEMQQAVEMYLSVKKDGWLASDVAEVVGVPESELMQKYASQFPIRADVFHLYRRAKHVFEESARVFQFKSICEEFADGDRTQKTLERTMRALGSVMNASQESCRVLFECSCPELDELSQVARYGAYGSRLTGAGWGGCTVSLVARHQVPKFIETVKREYYAKRPHLMQNKTSFDDVIFSSEAGLGAVVVECSE